MNKVEAFRKELQDGFNHIFDLLENLSNTREKSLAITKLQESVMWLNAMMIQVKENDLINEVKDETITEGQMKFDLENEGEMNK